METAERSSRPRWTSSQVTAPVSEEKVMVFLYLLLLIVPALATDYDIVEGEVASTLVQAKVPYRAIIPKGVKGKIPVVYFLHGRDGNRHQFRDVEGETFLRAKGKKYAVVALTGKFLNHNTYWVNDASDPKFPWKDVVITEMIPEIERKHNLGGSRDLRMIAGISMGSHGAWQLSLTTGLFRCVAGHSLVVRSFASMREQFPGKFGTLTQYRNRDPLSLLRRYKKRSLLPVKRFWVDIGGKDNPEFVARAQLVEAELRRLGVKPFDHVDVGAGDPDGRHDYPYWKKHMSSYLDWYGACFGL